MIELKIQGVKGKTDTTLIDECDEELNQFNWYAAKDKYHHSAYAIRHEDGHIIKLHRMIAARMFGEAALIGKVIDHIDGDGLNNVRSNLRLATQTQNKRNARKPKHNTSGYKGVWYDYNSRRTPWRACISFDNKTLHVGKFTEPEAAARAYDEAARKYHGEFAHLNFPEAK
jgi:hypothetical protein